MAGLGPPMEKHVALLPNHRRFNGATDEASACARISEPTDCQGFLSRWYNLEETTLSVEITRLCSLRCPGCCVSQSSERLDSDFDDNFMDPKLMSTTLRFGRAVGISMIQFVGGEPVLYPRLNDCLSFAHRIGYKRIALTSNGADCWKTYDSLLACGLTDISFSLDGSCPDVHDRIRPSVSGKSSFISVIDNIGRTVNRSKTLGTTVRVNHTLFPGNKRDAEKMIRLAASLGVDAVRIHFAFPGDHFVEGQPAEVDITSWMILPEEWMDLVRLAEGLSRELGLPIQIPKVYGDLEIKKAIQKRPGYLQVRPDGTLLMCNTHDRLWDKHHRYFARIISERALAVNKSSVVFDKAGLGTCCKSMPFLLGGLPPFVRDQIRAAGGIGCIYLPSPLLSSLKPNMET